MAGVIKLEPALAAMDVSPETRQSVTTVATVRQLGATGAQALIAHVKRALQLPPGQRLQDIQIAYVDGHVVGATIVAEQTVDIIDAIESDAAWAERRTP